jgi:hypothetical protein
LAAVPSIVLPWFPAELKKNAPSAVTALTACAMIPSWNGSSWK